MPPKSLPSHLRTSWMCSCLQTERKRSREVTTESRDKKKEKREREGTRTLGRHFREVKVRNSSRTIASSTKEGLRKKNEIEWGRRREGFPGRQCRRGE